MNALGEKGERIVREATRRYGKDRGRTRREKHEALGVKINMHSLFAVCSDLPSDPRFRRDRLKLTDEERNSHTLVCPMAEVWDQYDARRIGRIYCEEFHRACYQEYAFGLTQVNLAQTPDTRWGWLLRFPRCFEKGKCSVRQESEVFCGI